MSFRFPRILIVLIVLFSTSTSVFGSSLQVTKNMITLAEALYVSERGGVGDFKFIFQSARVLEIGKDLGKGKAVKFRLKGIYGFQKQSDPPPGWYSPTAVWVGDPVEAESSFDDVFVVYYKMNEFDKYVACGNVYCQSEENIAQCTNSLRNMKERHLAAKELDARREAEYAQRLRDEEAQRRNQERLNQLRREASVPSVTIGTYKCVNRYFSVFEDKVADEDLILTDVDASYIRDYRNEPPHRTKVTFSFENIDKVENRGGYIAFELKREIWIRPGDRAWGIEFADAAEASRFYDDLLQAVRAWNRKHPELASSQIGTAGPEPSTTSQPDPATPGNSPLDTSYRTGTVELVKESAGYSYIQLLVVGDDEFTWVATAKTDVAEGDVIEYPESPPLRDFTSKSLEMTFKEITFAPEIRNLGPEQEEVEDTNGEGEETNGEGEETNEVEE